MLAVFDRGVPGIDPGPPTPYSVTAAVTPAEAQATLAPRGGAIGPTGRLTILEVPATEGTLQPLVLGENGLDEQPRRVARVPKEMLAGVRGFYRLGLLPPDEQERLVVVDAVEVHSEGRLLLVDGCFRFRSPNGPLVVFGPESRLGLVDGYLVVGQKGLPARYSARVGEVIAWEGGAVRAIDEEGKAAAARRCGGGEVIHVPAWSASVRKAADDSRTATLIAAEMNIGFEEGLALLRRCGEPARRAVEKGPVSSSVEQACALARQAPIMPPPAPDIRSPAR
jgi:hypothetical protein